MALLKSNMESLKPGDNAPSFNLKNIDGSMISDKDFVGKPLAVIFMCNHCPYVKPKMEEIAQLMQDFKGKAGIVGINSNDPVNYPEDDFEHMQQAAEEFGFDFYLFDETQKVAKAYGAECTPDPFVFDKDHKLVYHGRINNAMNPNDEPTTHDLRDVLQKTLAGDDVEEWFLPSMGCSIKWK